MRKDGKLKPDPEKVKVPLACLRFRPSQQPLCQVSEKEYNPFLRGEESNLPASCPGFIRLRLS